MAEATGNGGGAVDNHGTLDVTSCTFSANTTPGGGGGAIFSENNAGPLTVTNSTFSGNTAFVEGGAINVYNADMHISNSTFSNNSAGTEGGAIRNQACCVAGNTISNSTFSNNSVYGAGGQGGAVYDTGPLAITNSTVSGNSASAAGGIYFHASFVTLGGNIIANSTNGNCGDDGGGGFTDSGYNLADDNGSTCGLSVANNDVLNVNPMLMALADNGGPNGTQTMALSAGSPAIDVIPAASCPPYDQRGITRPDSGESFCDIGAYESTGPTALRFSGFHWTRNHGGVVTFKWRSTATSGLAGFAVFAMTGSKGSHRLDRKLIAVHPGTRYAYRARYAGHGRFMLRALSVRGGWL